MEALHSPSYASIYASAAITVGLRNLSERDFDWPKNETRRDIMGHLENCLDGLSRRTSKRSCEKASRRLRSLIAKARRWGLTTEEVAELPVTKRLVPTRVTSTSATWTTLAMVALILGGGIVLAFICAPCITRGRTWGWNTKRCEGFPRKSSSQIGKRYWWRDSRLYHDNYLGSSRAEIDVKR